MADPQVQDPQQGAPPIPPPPDQGQDQSKSTVPGVGKLLIPFIGQALHQRDMFNYLGSRAQIDKAAQMWNSLADQGSSQLWDPQYIQQARQNAFELLSTPFNKKPRKELLDVTPFIQQVGSAPRGTPPLMPPGNVPLPQGSPDTGVPQVAPALNAPSSGPSGPGFTASGAPQSPIPDLQTEMQQYQQALQSMHPFDPRRSQVAQQIFAIQKKIGELATSNAETMAKYWVNRQMGMPPSLSAEKAVNPAFTPLYKNDNGAILSERALPGEPVYLGQAPQVKEVPLTSSLVQTPGTGAGAAPGATVGSAPPIPAPPGQPTTLVQGKMKLVEGQGGRFNPDNPSEWQKWFYNPLDPTQGMWQGGYTPDPRYLPTVGSTSGFTVQQVQGPNGTPVTVRIPQVTTHETHKAGVPGVAPTPTAGGAPRKVIAKPQASNATPQAQDEATQSWLRTMPPGTQILGNRGLSAKDTIALWKPASDAGVRFNVMAQNYEDAVKSDDQQAMLSLLANHLGMTMGLQRGARMNQALIEEAEKSRPWLQGVATKFDRNGYLTGVTLSKAQMQQMINLARERFQQEYQTAKSQSNFSGGTGEGPVRQPSPAVARFYMSQAQGDKGKAKQLAAADGWSQ